LLFDYKIHSGAVRSDPSMDPIHHFYDDDDYTDHRQPYQLHKLDCDATWSYYYSNIDPVDDDPYCCSRTSRTMKMMMIAKHETLG
jgi:hypothetical protein